MLQKFENFEISIVTFQKYCNIYCKTSEYFNMYCNSIGTTLANQPIEHFIDHTDEVAEHADAAKAPYTAA